MRRTTRQKMRVRLTAAQGGYDPLTHYWYKAEKNDYRRVCDDEPWLSGLRWKVPPEALTCGLGYPAPIGCSVKEVPSWQSGIR